MKSVISSMFAPVHPPFVLLTRTLGLKLALRIHLPSLRMRNSITRMLLCFKARVKIHIRSFVHKASLQMRRSPISALHSQQRSPRPEPTTARSCETIWPNFKLLYVTEYAMTTARSVYFYTKKRRAKSMRPGDHPGQLLETISRPTSRQINAAKRLISGFPICEPSR